MKNIWVVTDSYNSPGRILGVFSRWPRAIKFADDYKDPAIIERYTIDKLVPTKTLKRRK